MITIILSFIENEFIVIKINYAAEGNVNIAMPKPEAMHTFFNP